MPKKTFINLPESKKKMIINAFLIEFSKKNYDDASISDVVKKTGISKGSIYQYFDNKLDLFSFLIGECAKAKMQFIGSVKREEFPDFWSYFRALYAHGSHFDESHPIESNFLYNLWKNLRSPSVKQLHDQMLFQRLDAFEGMIKHEIDLGLFKDGQPVRSMAFLMLKIGESIAEELMLTKIIDPEKSIKEKKPMFLGKEKELLKVVDGYISLIKPTFNK